eukprot:1635721-Prymnesium_polylepis.2
MGGGSGGRRERGRATLIVRGRGTRTFRHGARRANDVERGPTFNTIHPGCDTTAELIHSDEP